MEELTKLVSNINSFIWGMYCLIPLLCGVGIYFTIRLKFIQVRKFGQAVRMLFGDLSLKEGQYIGFVGKEILASGNDRYAAAVNTAAALDFTDHEICILIRGRSADTAEAEQIGRAIQEAHRGLEFYLIDGLQDIYDYILILE